MAPNGLFRLLLYTDGDPPRKRRVPLPTPARRIPALDE